MTREERIAAGWVECWGIREPSTGRWLTKPIPGRMGHFSMAPVERRSFPTARSALSVALDHSTHDGIPARFWRRKKGRELKVGDEVTVRGTISYLDQRPPCPPGMHEVTTGGGAVVRVFRTDCERVKP